MAIDNVMQRGLERWPSNTLRRGVVTGRRIVLRGGGMDIEQNKRKDERQTVAAPSPAPVVTWIRRRGRRRYSQSRRTRGPHIPTKVGPAGPAGRCPNPAIPTESSARSRVHESHFGRTRLAEFESTQIKPTTSALSKRGAGRSALRSGSHSHVPLAAHLRPPEHKKPRGIPAAGFCEAVSPNLSSPSRGPGRTYCCSRGQ